MKSMTAREIVKFLGKQGKFRANGTGLVFTVEVLDVRHDGYTLEFLVSPRSGEGESWMSEACIALVEEK